MKAAALPRDLLAGLTVGVSQVGNVMAYTMLAGVPPVHGLYAATVGTPVAALTLSSQRMTAVTTAALGLAAGAALVELPPAQRTDGLFTLAVLAGAIMLAAGLLRAGGLVRFISNAVMVGFMTGVAVQIILSQLGALTGFASSYDNRVARAVDLALHPGRAELASALTGVATIALIALIARTRLKYFAAVSALVVGTAAAAALHLPLQHVADIAPIPGAFPLPRIPDLSLAPALLLPAFALALIALVQGVGISHTVPNDDGSRGEASRDFAAVGLANIAAGCFAGAPLGGSVQATALNVGAGARTRWSSVFAGVVVLAVILAAVPLIGRVPVPVIAAILVTAAFSAIRLHPIRAIWAADWSSALVMTLTFALVLVVPLHYAVLGGAALTLVKYVYLSSLDVRVVRVVIDSGGRCREAETPERLAGGEVTVLDIYGSLFFASGPKLRASLPAAGGTSLAIVVLRLRGRGTLHATTLALLRDYAAELAAGGGRLYLAGVGPEMAGQLERTGLLRELGEDAVLPATDEYYGSCRAAQERGRDWLGGRGRTAP